MGEHETQAYAFTNIQRYTKQARKYARRLRILTRKKHPQIMLQRFRKVWVWSLGWLLHQINSLENVLKLEQDSVLCDRFTLYFSIVLVLTSASGRGVFYRNVAFSILKHSTKNRCSSFLKRLCVSKLKRFKISSNCQIKTCHLSNGGLF